MTSFSDVASLTGPPHDDVVISSDNSAVLSITQEPVIRQNAITRRVFCPSRETQAGSSETEEWVGNNVTEIGRNGSSNGGNLRRQHLFTRSHRTSREQNLTVRSLNSASSSTSNTTTMMVELNGSRSRNQSNANPMVCFCTLMYTDMIFNIV